MTPRDSHLQDDRVFAKCAWRLIPLMFLFYLVSFIDRTNAGFAALTMNKDLGFSPAVFGFGAGIFFIGYSIFQIPANLMLERVGARRWMFCILAVWGLLSASNALVRSPAGFYGIRFLLGAAEAGCFPGMLLYLTYWFPRKNLAQFTALFAVANPMSAVIGAPLGSSILATTDGIAGVHGWQWLFAIEAIPALLLAFAALRFLPDGPNNAAWLNEHEKQVIVSRVETRGLRSMRGVWRALRDLRVIALGVANFSFQASGYGMAFFVPQVVRGLGFSIGATGFVVAVPFIAGSAAMILCGRSAAKRGERILHASLPWLFAAGAYFAASLVHDNWIVLVALVFGAMGLYGAFGSFMSLPSSFLAGSEAAAGIGLFNTLGSLGGFFGPSLVGILRQSSGDYATGLAAISVGFAFAGLIVLALGRVLVPRHVPQAVPAE
jgi:ACS family tartrate transporter-like MFS transporter